MAQVSPHFQLQLGALRSSTDRPVAGPVRFSVVRPMGGAAESLEIDLVQRQGVAPGDAATLALGFDGATETVFTGSVVEVIPSLQGVRVLALGRMDALLRHRSARRWEARSAGSVVRDLAGAVGLATGQVDDGPTLPSYAIDMRLNAAAHLRRLAARLGFELFTGRDGKLHFRALGAAASLDSGGLGGLAGAAAGAATALLGGGGGGGGTGYAAGKHLIAAQAHQRAAGITQVVVGGEGPASSHGDQSSWWLSTGADTNHGSAGSAGAGLLLLDAAARTQDLAGRFAAGSLATLQRSGHRLLLRTLGRAALELGDDLQVSAAADAAINASGYVCQLQHRLGPDTGFVTDISVQAGGAP
jgi:hypothetical protein